MADSDLWGSLGYSAPTSSEGTSDADALKAIVERKAQQYGIPSDLADRLVTKESAYNPRAKSPKGAMGLTQLMPDTAKTYGVADATDPETNVDGGFHYLADLKAKYGDWPRALAAYNAGPEAVDKAGGVPNIPETQAYVKAILGAPDGKPPAGGLWDSLGYTGEAPKDTAAPDTIQFTGLNAHSTPQQTQTWTTLAKAGVLDKNAPPGTAHQPYGIQPGFTEKDVPPGAYYVPPEGGVKRAPGGKDTESATAKAGEGALMGAGDVLASLSHVMPGTDDSTIKSSLLAHQMLYGARLGGDTSAGAGRFTGQLLASAPLVGGAAEGAVPLIARVSPQAAAFISGSAGGWKGAGLASKLLRVGSLAEAGGNVGAGTAALTSSANPEPLPQQIASGYAGGALVGPVAPAFSAVGRGAGRLVGSLVRPLTAGGQENIVSGVLGDVSGGSAISPDLTLHVPGVEPTLGEASGNAGVATLERNIRANPRVAQRFAERAAQNDEARVNAFRSLSGDKDSISALEDAREAATSGAREAALKAQTQPADVKPVLDTIDAILKGPEGKRKEVVSVLNDVRQNLHDAQGNPETSAELLYGVRKDINDLLSGKASQQRGSAQLAASQLKQVRDALDQSIEAVAPGFKKYLSDYANLSKPIDEQRFLQGLNITDTSGKITLSGITRALKKIDAEQAKPGANEAKSITPQTYAGLKAIRDDLARASNIDLGKSRGSPTVQNFVTEGIAKAAGIPSDLANVLGVHPKAGAVMGLGKLLYGSKNPQVLDRLATRLLDPANAPAPVAAAPSNKLLSAAGKAKRLATPKPAAVAGLLANRLTAPQ
jgi:hypothetical protein